MARVQVCPGTFLLVRNGCVEQHVGRIEIKAGGTTDIPIPESGDEFVIFRADNDDLAMAWADGRRSVTGQVILTP